MKEIGWIFIVLNMWLIVFVINNNLSALIISIICCIFLFIIEFNSNKIRKINEEIEFLKFVAIRDLLKEIANKTRKKENDK